MTVFSKRGSQVFSPTDASNNPRSVINSEAQTWSAEVEQAVLTARGGGWDASGTLSSRDTYDDEAAGFTYLETDNVDGNWYLHIKDSATSGDWSSNPQQVFKGTVGAKGDPGDNFTVNTTGTTAERADFDDELAGFAFLDTDQNLLFIKDSDTSGDWSVGLDFYDDATDTAIDTSAFDVSSGSNVQDWGATVDAALLDARSTGIREGGDLTDQGSGVVRIAAGKGNILDNTAPEDPDYTAVSWSQTDIDLSAADNVYYIYVDAAGDVLSTTTKPFHTEYRTEIWLWRVSIRGGVVSGATPIVQPVQQYGPQIWDIWRAIGYVKRGLAIGSASTDLTINMAAGEVYMPGIGFFADATNPHKIDLSATSPVTFRHVDQDGDQTADRTALDVGNYDLGGTITAIPGSNNRAQIFTWMLFPGGPNHRIFYGQEYYDTVGEALQALTEGRHTPIRPSIYEEEAITLGWVIAQKGATDLSDGVQVFVTSNSFGLAGGAIATSGANALLASNNLSDLPDKALARQNLEVEIGADVQAWSAVLDGTTASFTVADETKLDGIEGGATADQTGAEIKAAYEGEADTNALTDALLSKLNGIEANATADQTGAEIKTAYEAEADTNAFTDALLSKLNGIEASADVTDTANVTAAGALMSVGDLSDLAGSTIETVNVSDFDDGGLFDFDPSDLSANVTADANNRIVAPRTGDLTGATGAYVRRFVGEMPMTAFTGRAVADGTVDCAAAVQDCFDYHIDLGRGVIKVDGLFQLDSAVVPDAYGLGVHLTVIGMGNRTSGFKVNNSTGGIFLDGNRSSKLECYNFGVFAMLANAGTGLSRVTPAGGNQLERINEFRNLFIGPWDFSTGDYSFNKPLVATGAYRTLLSNIITGQSASATHKMVSNIDISGTFKPKVEYCYGNGSATYGLYRSSTNPEGCLIEGSTFVGADQPLCLINTSAEPELFIVGNHFNGREKNVIKGVKYGMIRDNLMYCQSGNLVVANTYVDWEVRWATGLQFSGNAYRQDASARIHYDIIEDTGEPVKDIHIDDRLFHSSAGRIARISTGVANVTIKEPHQISDEAAFASGKYDVQGNAEVRVIREGDPSTLVQLNSANQTLTTATWTDIDWDTVIRDEPGLMATAGTDFTIPDDEHIRFVEVRASVRFNTNNSGVRSLRLLINGSEVPGGLIIQRSAHSGDTMLQAVSGKIAVTDADVIKVQAFQSSGGNLDIESSNNTWAEVRVL